MPRNPRSFIDGRQPTTWPHPLAIERRFWGLASPNNQGGTVYQDLTLAGNDGTLTNFVNLIAGTDGWATDSRPGGAGSLLFNGSSSYVVLPATSSLNIFSSDITLACWVNWVATSTSNHLIGGYQNGGAFDGYAVRHDSTSGKIQFWDSTAWRTSSITTATLVGAWHRLVGTVNTIAGSTAVSFYLDGVFQSSVACNQPVSYLGTRALGAKQGGGEWANCYLDDIAIIARGWDAGLAALDFDLSQRGNPRLLRRRRRASIGFTTTVVYSGSGTPQLSPFTLSATGSVAVPSYSGSAAPSVSAILLAATGTITGTIYAGTAAPQLSAVLLAGAGSVALPHYTGVLGAQMSSVLLVAAGSTTLPVPSSSPDWTKTQSIDATTITAAGPDPTRTKSVLR